MPGTLLLVGEVVSDRSLSRPNLKFASGELVFGYRLIRELGRGSFGQVWLATNDKGFEWALKIVSLAGSGGKKEFRALQLIKDRKIKSTHLLKLIDYGLLDQDGTSLSTTPSAESTPRIIPVLPPMRGTMIPQDPINPAARTSIERMAARDTQHNREPDLDGPTDFHSRAVWLVIVMEVGDRTLHELQLAETRHEKSQRVSRATRAVDRSGTVLGAKKPSAQTAVQVESHDEPLAPLPVARILPYIEQAARGLDYLHRNDILHRDVKPQNIMLVDADAKLCDYGLASEVRNTTATTEGCSPAYAAPEAINNRPVPASDQYSLAVTYIELISGRWPFYGTTQTAIYREKDEGRHNLTFIRNRRTRQVLSRALAKNPEDRFPSCTEFAQELALAEQTPQRSLVAPVLKTVGALCLVAMLAAAGYLLKDRVIGWFKRTPVVILEEKFDPLTSVKIPRASVGKLATSDVSLVIERQEPVLRSLERSNLIVEQHHLRRALLVENPPLVGELSRMPRARYPQRPTKPLPAFQVSAVPPLPKPVFRNADEELTALWQAQVNAPDDFLNRFVELIGKSQRVEHWWTEVTRRVDEQPKWHTACERSLVQWTAATAVLTPPLQNMPGFSAFELKVKDLSADRMLQSELRLPIDIPRLTASPAFVLNADRVIARLLRSDWELRSKLSSSAALEETWLTARLSELEPLSAAAADDEVRHPDWQQFRHFVRAQLNSRRNQRDAASAAIRDLNALLQSERLPGWLGPQRRDLLVKSIGRVSIANISCTAGDLPRFHELQAIGSAEWLQLQRQAEVHQLTSPATAAAGAIIGATAVDKPDWRKINGLATTALADAETKRVLQQQDRWLVLEYVAALAQLRLNATGGTGIDYAIDRLATILQTGSASGQRYFDFPTAASAQDEGILGNLILPVLEHPAASTLPANHPQAVNLAALWGAQGRLLQRNPAIVSLLTRSPHDSQTQVAEALRVAHRSFDRARLLDAQSPRHVDYLVGYATTLVARPILSGENLARDGQLIRLVQRLPSEPSSGNTAPANLALLQGRVHRMQGQSEQAAKKYELALASFSASAGADILRETCLVDLCYVHLEQARLAPWMESDFRQTADPLVVGPPGSKSYYLQRALERAVAAEKLKTSLQREQAYLAKGQALEQMATTLGLTAKFSEALAAYKQAKTEADAARRPAAACLLSLGRCYVNGVNAPGLASMPESRKADLLKEAIQAFDVAIAEKVEEQLDEAKRACDLAAYYWRGAARLQLAKLPGQDTRVLEAEALSDFRRAIEQGKGVKSPEVGDAFLALLRHAKPANGLHTASSQLTAKGLLAACLEMLQQEPGNFTASALLAITEENRLPSQPGIQAPTIIPFIQWFSTSRPLPDQWTLNSEWKVAGARIAALASTSNAADEYRRTALELAYSIRDNEPRRNLALSFCQHKQLSLQVKTYQALQKSPASSPSGAATPSTSAGQGAGLTQLASAFENYYAAAQKSVDPTTQARLGELIRLPLEKLPGAFEKLSPLQQNLIRQHLLREITFEDRLKVWEHIESAQSGENSGGGNNRLNEVAHNLLKPAYLLLQLEPENTHVAKKLNGYTTKLKAIEEKLGIRQPEKPKEPAKVKKS